MSATTNLRVGPVTFTPMISVGFTALGFIWAIVVNLGQYGTDVGNEPSVLMTLAFWLFALAAICLFQDLGERFDTVLHRLWNRGALAISEEQLDEFKNEVRTKVQLAARIGSIFMFLCVVLFYFVAFIVSDKGVEVHALVQYPFEAGTAFIAGLFMGRTVVHAFVGYLLQKRSYTLKIIPGHPDRGAGVTPIGELFLRQAAVMLLPAIYFMLGWTVMSVAKQSNSGFLDRQIWSEFSEDWAAIYLLMFFAMMAVELLGFIAPMWLFHVEMKQQKSDQMVIADGLSKRIVDLKSRLADESDEGQIKLHKNRVAEMMSRHEEIENLPMWPVSLEVRRRFAISNLIVTLPLWIGLWQQISKLFASG